MQTDLSEFTRVIDEIFARPVHACRTLKGVLSTLNAHLTTDAWYVLKKHPAFAAVISVMRKMEPQKAEATAYQLYSYVVRNHSVRACRMDHARSMERFLQSLDQAE